MTPKEAGVSIANLRELLDYNPETGVLRWKARGRQWFRRDRDWKAWNTAFAGTEALTAKHPKGYSVGTIMCLNFKMAYAHRVAWAIHTGAWPDGEIDHENGTTGDNRFRNLRDVTVATNAQNAQIRKTNTSGVTGVSFDRRSGMWEARINSGGRRIRLGSRVAFGDAVQLRVAAELKYGYHPNHGRLPGANGQARVNF